ncbi:phosphoenolpyruvate synthase, partial [Trichonephila clavata]
VIYWIKWLIAYIAIRFSNAYHKKRFNLYDIYALGDPVKLGFIVPQLERDLESPFPESHLEECADEVVFYGVNSKSECLLVRIARSDSKVANAWIYLKLCNGKTYNLTETVDRQQLSDGKCQTFSCGKLQMHYLSPMRRWRIFFSGMLKEMGDGKKDFEESVFVKFVFL